MLDIHYSAKLAEVIRLIDWTIELPPEWGRFFHERGAVSSSVLDQRRHQRINVRAQGVLWFTDPLPACPRPADPIGIYTRDVSRRGFGFISPTQLFPEEGVRVALPTFWMDVRIVRSHSINPSCFVTGAELIAQHQPEEMQFEMPDAVPSGHSDHELAKTEN